jgi:glycerate 2-kinase
VITRPDRLRRDAVEGWRAGVRAAAPVAAVEAAVARRPGLLACPARTLVVATGKAAISMLRGYGAGARGYCLVPEGTDLSGLPLAVRAEQGGHPIPTRAGIAASRRVLAAVEALKEGDRLVYLVSGGSSALFEVPREGIEDDAIIDTYALLLASGMSIHETNCVRRALSAVKGGRFARAAGAADLTTFAVSDVVGDVPADIGSGPTVAANDPPSRALELVTAYDLLGGLPASVRRVLEDVARGGESVATSERGAGEREFEVVVSVLAAEDGAEARMEALGYELFTPASARLLGDAETAAWGLVEAIGGVLAARSPTVPGPRAFVLSGETTVRLPERPGRGGRNQHIACLVAGALAGTPGFACVVAGTDGRDGDSALAGAVIDGTTAARAAAAGCDLAEAVRRFDSEAAVLAAGDALATGPTGTNVGDLVVATIDPKAGAQ